MKTSKKQKEAIEMLDKFITEHKLYNIKQSDGLEDNIKIVLNLIEKLQKENEELKEENEYNKILLDMNNNFTIDKKTGNYKWNVIEIQKVKDKIEEYKNMLKTCNKVKDIDRIKAINERILELQELIEEER